jgi:hypothetical protein
MRTVTNVRKIAASREPAARWVPGHHLAPGERPPVTGLDRGSSSGSDAREPKAVEEPATFRYVPVKPRISYTPLVLPQFRNL